MDLNWVSDHPAREMSEEDVVTAPKSFRDIETTVEAVVSSLKRTFLQPKTRRSESSVRMASTSPTFSKYASCASASYGATTYRTSSACKAWA